MTFVITYLLLMALPAHWRLTHQINLPALLIFSVMAMLAALWTDHYLPRLRQHIKSLLEDEDGM